MDIQVVIRGYDQGLVQHLLDTVREMGEPLSLVNLRPMGLFIPVNLAIKAGLLELLASPAPEPPRKRRPRRSKTMVPAEPEASQDPLWED